MVTKPQKIGTNTAESEFSMFEFDYVSLQYIETSPAIGEQTNFRVKNIVTNSLQETAISIF